ncbi:hypothetical protein [Cellulomonas sp. NPDC058312]|uniref:hypothetical protein n=1 Tax=Cellulomonas sp. NPDC058312 TaxID=3346441 RepID=UPI0036E07E79
MSRTRSATAPAVLLSVGVLALVTACSGATAATDATTDDAARTQAPAGATEERRPGGGTTGEIASVGDALLQVQGDDGQTAVSWDDGTTITQTVAAALADVSTGTCVVALTSGDDDAAAATSVTLTAATDGGCTTGFGGGMPSGAAPEGMPTGAPADGDLPELPEGGPTGAPGAGERPEGGGFGGVTAGLVTAVDGSTITVDSDGTSATITVDDATTYTTTVAADSGALTVGRCVTAQGEADSSGQVAATVLLVSDAGEDGCTTGFGGRGPDGAGGPAGSGAAADESEGEAAGA